MASMYTSALGGMFGSSSQHHSNGNRNHYGQTQQPVSAKRNFDIQVDVQNSGTRPPRYDTGKSGSSLFDSSLFNNALSEPKQVQTGSFTNSLTGEVVPIFEKELPPADTTVGYITPEQLKHTNPRMVWQNGGFDHNKPPRHKTEVRNDDPTRDSGPNVFGSQLYTAQIRERQDEDRRRQLFMNRNGIVPERHEYANGEHKITGVRFRPTLPETQQLDLQGRLPNKQAFLGLDARVVMPSGAELKKEILNSMNVRTPLSQPVAHLNIPIPVPTFITPTFSTRNDINDSHQGQMTGGHAMGDVASTVHHTMGTFSFDPNSLRATLKSQHESINHNVQVQQSAPLSISASSQADNKSQSIDIKNAHIYNQGNFNFNAPIYSGLSGEHAMQTKDTSVKQALVGQSFSIQVTNPDMQHGGTSHLMTEGRELPENARSMTQQLGQGFTYANNPQLAMNQMSGIMQQSVQETQANLNKSQHIQSGGHQGGVEWQVAHASSHMNDLARDPILKQSGASGLQNLAPDNQMLYTLGTDAHVRESTTYNPTSKLQLYKQYMGGVAVTSNAADTHRTSQTTELPANQKQNSNPMATTSHVEMPHGTGDTSVFQLAEAERSLYTTKNFGALRDQSHQNIQHSTGFSMGTTDILSVQTNDLMSVPSGRQQMGTVANHLQVNMGINGQDVAGMSGNSQRTDPTKQQHYQMNQGGVTSLAPETASHHIMTHQAADQWDTAVIKTQTAQQQRQTGQVSVDTVDTGDAHRRVQYTQVQLPQRVTYAEQQGRLPSQSLSDFQTGTSQGFEGGLRTNEKTSLEFISAPVTNIDMMNGIGYISGTRNATLIPTERVSTEYVAPLNNHSQQRFLPGTNTNQASSALDTYGTYDLHTQRGTEQMSVRRDSPRANINMRMSPRIVPLLPETGRDREYATPTAQRNTYYGEQ